MTRIRNRGPSSGCDITLERWLRQAQPNPLGTGEGPRSRSHPNPRAARSAVNVSLRYDAAS